MEALTEHGLVAEVAQGTFCFKNKIGAASIKLLWDKLSRFVADAIRQQKGVLMPNLGNFSVGPVAGETRKKVRPAFALLETRYAGVSQERPKYSIGGGCPVIQPNYGLLATASSVHRGACQRLVLELMQRLGAAILSGRPVAVLFPGVGRLYTNRAGRVQFDFDVLVREYFELERERVIPEMPYSPMGAGAELEEEPVARVVKGLQQVHLHNPPVIQQNSRPPTGASVSPSARVRRNAHAPYTGVLLDLWRLCKSNDRINSGCVSRLQLEQWLHRECATALRSVAAATVLELLATHTYGKTGKHILYKSFLDQLEGAIGDVSPVELSPRNVQSPRRIVEVRVDSPTGAQMRQQQAERQLQWEQEEYLEQYHGEQQQRQQQRQQQQGGGMQGRDADVEVTFSPAGAAPGVQFPPPPLALPRTPGMESAQGWYGPTPQQQAWQAGPTPGQGYGQTPSSAGGSDPRMPHHYYQNHLEPTSRLEYDNFNRVHFDKLEEVRGRDPKHRAVTPKVGEDELNRREYHAVRQVGDAVTPAQVLGLSHDLPYSRGTPQPVVSAARSRGSPGPRSQIMTLAHTSPSPSPSPQQIAVPGLPTHFYQPQPASRQATPHQHQQPSTPYLQQQQQQQQDQQQQQQQYNQHHYNQPQQSRGVTPSVSFQQRGVTPNQQQRGGTPLRRVYSARDAPPPREEEPPISQYEIINELDPVLKQRKRNELAHALQSKWGEQIREKESVLQNIAVAESQWPYASVGQPNDKRPSSAVSQPHQRWSTQD